jgi:hypothetical protein
MRRYLLEASDYLQYALLWIVFYQYVNMVFVSFHLQYPESLLFGYFAQYRFDLVDHIREQWLSVLAHEYQMRRQ